MKLNPILALAFAAGLAGANAQIVVDLSGSTAGRASVHSAIISVLGNVTTYGYTGSNIASASQAIFKGNYGGNAYIIRTSWSGSATGLYDLQTGTNNTFLPTTTNVAAGNVSGLATGTDSSAVEVAFSDVFVGSTTVPSSGLVNTNTFVIPFKWIASNRAGSVAGFTNVTPVQARALLNTGSLAASIFTGNSADSAVTVWATGRDNGSGTRITTLADIGYGVNSPVVQVQAVINANTITGITDFLVNNVADPNYGYTSGGTLAGVLNKQSTGDFADSILLAYLGLSDANTALNVSGAFPAKELTYNGVTYSPENVYNGKYSLWGYLHLYYKGTFTVAQGKSFADQLGTTLKTLPGSSGLNPALMQVYRDTDGGNIYSK